MAFEIQKIDPLDLQPRKAVGVDLPFSANAVFNSTYQTKDAIKANLINYFLTNKGERYLNPNFGSNIRKLLFDNITEDVLDQVESTVTEDVETYFPRVIPTLVQVTSEPDANTVTFYMRYAIADSNIQDELIINFN